MTERFEVGFARHLCRGKRCSDHAVVIAKVVFERRNRHTHSGRHRREARQFSSLVQERTRKIAREFAPRLIEILISGAFGATHGGYLVGKRTKNASYAESASAYRILYAIRYRENEMNLIENRWYVVLTSRELRKKPVGRKRLGRDVVFWRDSKGEAHGALDSCPHRRAKLSPGRVEGDCITCPFHGFAFAPSGECTAIPAHPGRKLPRALELEVFPLREEYGFLWMWNGPALETDAPVPFFDFDGYSFAGSEFEEPVATHYTRAIENQLDFAHLAFVHRTTIGRLANKVVDVRTEVDGDLIVVTTESPPARIEFLGPGLWRNRTGPFWQFLAFVPIDDAAMTYYVRSYQKALRRGPLAWLFGLLQRFLNGIIIRQDTPVVETQPASETRLREMNEILVPSDEPIIAYRRWREAHRSPEASA